MAAPMSVFLPFVLSFFAAFSKAVPQNVICQDPQGQDYWGPPGCDATIIPTSPTQIACEASDGQIYWSPSDCTGNPEQTSQSLATNPCTLTSTIAAGTASYGCQGPSSTTYATGWLTANICVPKTTSSTGYITTGCVVTSYSTPISKSSLALSSLSSFSSAALEPSLNLPSSSLTQTYETALGFSESASSQAGPSSGNTSATTPLLSSSAVYSASSFPTPFTSVSIASSLISRSTSVSLPLSTSSSVAGVPSSSQTINPSFSSVSTPSGWSSGSTTALLASPTTALLESIPGSVTLSFSTGSFSSLTSKTSLSIDSSPSSGSSANWSGHISSASSRSISGRSSKSSLPTSSETQSSASYAAFSSSQSTSLSLSHPRSDLSQSSVTILTSTRHRASSNSVPSDSTSNRSMAGSSQSSKVPRSHPSISSSSSGFSASPGTSVSSTNSVFSGSISGSTSSLNAAIFSPSHSGLSSLPSTATISSPTSAVKKVTPTYELRSSLTKAMSSSSFMSTFPLHSAPSISSQPSYSSVAITASLVSNSSATTVFSNVMTSKALKFSPSSLSKSNSSLSSAGSILGSLSSPRISTSTSSSPVLASSSFRTSRTTIAIVSSSGISHNSPSASSAASLSSVAASGSTFLLPSSAIPASSSQKRFKSSSPTQTTARTSLDQSVSSSSLIISPGSTDKFAKSTGNPSSISVSTSHIATPTLTCTADANTASLVPSAGAKPDPTVCSCDNGQYYSTLSTTGSVCAYTASSPYGLLPPNAGPWSFVMPDLQPSICTATVFPVSTTRLMATGPFVVDVDWNGGDTWLFSADMGMNLSSLGYGELSTAPFTRNANGSYTLLVPSGVGSEPVTGLASGTPLNVTEASAHEFALTLSKLLTCDVPLPQSCQANDDELSGTQWDAFRTDEWWISYVSNYTVGGSEMTLFEELVYDYIGPPDEYHCTIGTTQLNGDGSLDPGSCTYPTCVSVNTTLSSKDGFRQGYMVLADWEGLSHFLNYCWGVLDQAQNGFDDVITAIYLSFYRDPALASWQSILPVIGTVFTLMCVVLLFIQPFWGGAAIATAANAIYAIGASMNGIANIKNLGIPNDAVLEWEGATNSQLDWRNYMSNMKSGLSNLHNSYFLNKNASAPVNITTVLLGGTYLPETPGVDQATVIPSDNVTAWLESYACARLINELFNMNSYYIVYIPYGSYVEDVTGYESRGNFSFEKSDCEQWVANTGWNNSVFATCDTVDNLNPGMTVMEGVQDSFLDFTTYNYKTAFTQVFNDGNFTYNPEDVIQSSIGGWLTYGYNYTLINQNYGFSPDALDSVEDFREQLFAVANIRSNNSGIHNLPICVLNDLASMPECGLATPTNDNDGAKTPLTWDQSSYCYVHPMNCLGDQSGVLPTQNASYGFQYFRDHISDRLKNNLNSPDLAGPFPDKKRDVHLWKTIDVKPKDSNGATARNSTSIEGAGGMNVQ